MTAILTLSDVRPMDKGHGHYRIIPVTVISAAGKKVRVVVGIVDSKKEEVKVRTSRIMDLSEELGELDYSALLDNRPARWTDYLRGLPLRE